LIKLYYSLIERPEIKLAKKNGLGSNIRKSSTTNNTYFYYTKKFKNYYIRIALPYNEDVIDLLQTNNLFLYFLLGLFIVIMLIIITVSDRHAKTIKSLKMFATKAAKNEPLDNFNFGDRDLKEIGKQINSIYENRKNIISRLTLEKDKLTKHIDAFWEGVAVYNEENNIILSNQHFNRFIGMVIDESFGVSFNKLIKNEVFKSLREKFEKYCSENISLKDTKLLHSKIEKNGKIFTVKLIIFQDHSKELVINEVTQLESNKKLKEQMTANIAHELKTPISSINGFLETIINHPELDRETVLRFINKAHDNGERLVSLVSDMTTINRIDEAKESFDNNSININSIIKEIIFDFQDKLEEKNIGFDSKIDDVVIEGNSFLIDAIFRNLIDNSIKYGGEDLFINIKQSFEDNDYFYFSYYDSGKGIDKKHLPRIFERFYRVDKGRSRNLGGTGLGLSIVKHAVKYHHGEINIKLPVTGGLEFTFCLKKKTK